MKARLHVLHVSMPTSEGAAIVAQGYVRDQVARGWNVTVACPSEGWLGYSARELGARVRWWSARRGPDLAVTGEMLTLSRIVRECRPDVVHLHSAKAGLVGRLLVRGSVPTVYQPHGWSFLAAEGGVAAAALRWERAATRWTDHLVCVSEDEQELGEEHGVHAPTSVLPNAVDLASWTRQTPADRLAARKAVGLPPEAPVAVCVGRLAAQKGQHDLLDVWPTVRGRVPDARLVLVGEGPDREALQRRAATLPEVSLTGGRTDVLRWLAAADVVVVPSRWEGMALVPLEAMAAGRSVVATAVAGIGESVPAGAGVVVRAGERVELCEAVAHRLVHRDRADAEGDVGRAHVEREFDLAGPAGELSQVYLQLLGQRRRSSR